MTLRKRFRPREVVEAVIGACLAAGACSPGCLAAPPDLTVVSMEDLMNVQVRSVSKKEESLSQVGAAAFVLNSEDIRRSGATDIPGLLRLVPGVDVATIDGHTWAISIRGFNGTYANKVLVLIDGRSVYSPLTAGVNWDSQDLPLEDIDRIEVIRGPGGTIWGANAVNGVIDIITKRAGSAPGATVVAGGGSHTAARDLAQYEGAMGPKGDYRVFANYSDTMGQPLPGGARGADSWHDAHLGGRTDWTLSSRDDLTIEGDLSRTGSGSSATIGRNPHIGSDAGDIVGRWTRRLASGSEASLQASFDHYTRLEDTAWDEFRNTLDLDFHYRQKLGARHDLLWGLGYRVTSEHVDAGDFVSIAPAQRVNDLFSAFAQDEIALGHAVSLTLGTKVEHNPYTGVEFEPSVQLVWRPSAKQQVWASAARALRDPTQSDVGLHAIVTAFPNDSGGYSTVEAFGQPGLKSEELRDFELGYRVDSGRRLSVDVAAFFSLWRNLSQAVPSQPFLAALPEPHVVFPETLTSLGRGRSYGGEVFATWQIASRWKVIPSLSFSHIQVDNSAQNVSFTGNTDGTTPRLQFQVRSLVDLPGRFEWDSTFSSAGALADFGAGPVPGYTRLDTRIGRRFGEGTEISVTGQNLLTPRHAEFPDDSGVRHTLVERAIFARITLRF